MRLAKRLGIAAIAAVVVGLGLPSTGHASDETVRSAPYDSGRACGAAYGAAGFHGIGVGVGNRNNCQPDEKARTTGILSNAYASRAAFLVVGAEAAAGTYSDSVGVTYVPTTSGTLTVSADVVAVNPTGAQACLWATCRSAESGTMTTSGPVIAGQSYDIEVGLVGHGELTVNQIRVSLQP
jgi:hypothetical protein